MKFIFFVLLIVSCERKNLNQASTESALIGRIFYNTKGYDYGKLISGLTNNVVLPSFAELQTNSENLNRVALAFDSSQTLTNLQNLRTAYNTFKDSIERVEVYGFNTTNISVNLFTNLDMYPSFSLDTAKLESEEINSVVTINLSRVQNNTISKRTVMALEYLLYDNGLDNSDINLNFTTLQANPRRIQYILGLTGDLQIRAKNFNDTWKNSFVTEYQTGTNSFSSLNDVLGKQVNFMNDMLTSFIDNKIGDPAGLSAKSRGIIDLNKLESRFSNRSLEDIQVNFESVKNLYFGTFRNNTEVVGITDLVKSVNPRLDVKLRDQFSTIDSQISSMKQQGILRQAIQSRFSSVQTLHTSFRNLRIIFQNELFSSLGTNFQIGNADGD